MNPTELKPFVCKSCPAILNDECAFKTHQLIHTKGESDKMIPFIEQKSYKCDSCAYTCSAKSNMKNHQRTHRKEKPYMCIDCDEYFTESCALNLHTK